MLIPRVAHKLRLSLESWQSKENKTFEKMIFRRINLSQYFTFYDKSAA